MYPRKRVKIFSVVRKRKRIFATDPETERTCLDCGYETVDDVDACPQCGSTNYESSSSSGSDYEFEAKNFSELTEKLFSRLKISITKSIEIDPIDMDKRESVIDSLAGHRGMGPRGIMLIKRAHGLAPLTSNIPIHDYPELGDEVGLRTGLFSEGDIEWIEDSGIEGDIALEFGGSTFELGDFYNILKERYPDAPKNLIDQLKDRGVLTTVGNKVKITN